MERLVKRLRQDYPDFIFTAGTTHCWSPKGQEIFYTPDNPAGLLHELAHARLKHRTYRSDMELLRKELAAWEEAQALGQQYDIALDRDYVEDCLDTYRDWLHKRSTCPTCGSTGLQQGDAYVCPNCCVSWQVTTARLRRPYRRTIHKTER